MPSQLTNLGSDGKVFGQTVSDKIGFYGVSTAIVQPSGALAVTTATPTVTAFGFTSAQAGQIISAINFLTTALGSSNLNLIR